MLLACCRSPWLVGVLWCWCCSKLNRMWTQETASVSRHRDQGYWHYQRYNTRRTDKTWPGHPSPATRHCSISRRLMREQQLWWEPARAGPRQSDRINGRYKWSNKYLTNPRPDLQSLTNTASARACFSAQPQTCAINNECVLNFLLDSN